MDLALLVLRIIVGGLFVAHGANKIANSEAFAGFMAALKVPYPKLAAKEVAFAEFWGGIGLILGYGYWAAPVILIAVMVGAIALVHRRWNPFITSGGWEYCAVIIAVNILFIVAGFGEYRLGA